MIAATKVPPALVMLARPAQGEEKVMSDQAG